MICVEVSVVFVLTVDERDKAAKQAEEQAKNMQLNVVRLCFQVYMQDEDGKFSRMLPSVLSDCIYDSSQYDLGTF